MIVDTDTGEILDLKPIRIRPDRSKRKIYRRGPFTKDDSALLISLLGLLVASIALTN